MPVLKQIDPYLPEVRSLLVQSDQLMSAMYPPESNHLEPPRLLARDNVMFLGAYEGDELLGCGAVKVVDNDEPYGEIKRVFVIPAARGRGIASLIMQQLEAYLVNMNIPVARLETGIRQHEAICLYRKLGYTERGPFGTYHADPLSLFMEKRFRI